jgi:hypothetical protein
VNRSGRELGRTGMLSDAGAPRCAVCGHPLHFGSDRQGRTIEFCDCGYSGYVKTRGQADRTEHPAR